MNFLGHYKDPGSSSSPTLSDASAVSSNLSPPPSPVMSLFVSQHKYKRISYYNNITRDSDHLELIYHSDFLTILLLKPISRHAHIPVKSLHGVFYTLLNGAWKINWSSINSACFFTHRLSEEEGKGSLSSIIIWVNVIPGSVSSNTSHEVSQEILSLLWKNGVRGAVVEWHKVYSIFSPSGSYN
ncbi:hypothetical protein F4604DRAFT_1885309 [Suillus subluteus]|nr:hypothetical protein F4604DRAFT_1885309 [Suillus subluteus]